MENQKEKNNQLLVAAEQGDVAAILSLLEQGADPDARHWNSYTTLMCAAWHGHHDAVRVLLEHGVDIHATSKSIHSTALHIASWKGYTKIVQLLLGYGANIDAINNEGNTALMRAVWRKHNETVMVLLAAGADLAIINQRSKTALMIAQQQENVPIMGLLESIIEKRQLLGTMRHAHIEQCASGISF